MGEQKKRASLFDMPKHADNSYLLHRGVLRGVLRRGVLRRGVLRRGIAAGRI
jgi:hypothetical protein